VNQIRPVAIIFLFITGLVLWNNSAMSAEVFDFAVIQPGQPGTSREAQPIMDALATYLQRFLIPTKPFS
jgi:hypothetical protein